MEQTTENKIIIRAQVEEADYVQYTLGTAKDRFKKFSLIWGLIAFFVIVGLINFLTTPEGGSSSIGTAMTLVLFLIGLGVLIRMLLIQSSKKSYAANELMHAPHWYRFSSEGLEQKGASHSSKITWGQLHEVVESKDMLLFYLPTKHAFIVPKRWFHSQEQIDDIRLLIRAHMPKQKAHLQKDTFKTKFLGSPAIAHWAPWQEEVPPIHENSPAVAEQVSETDNTGIHLRVRLEEKERVRFGWKTLYRRYTRQPLALLLFFALLIWGSTSADSIASLVPVLVIIFVVLPFSITRALKKPLLEHEMEEFHYQITHWGIENRSASSSSKTPWNQLEQAIESADSFVFYITTRQAYLIPKRCFDSPAQIEQLRELIKQRMPQDKTEWPKGA